MGTPAPGEPATQRNLRLDALDALRGVLSWVVCLGHAIQVFIGPTLGPRPTEHGFYFASFGAARVAVLSFFCLSGFVIATSVRRNTLRAGEFRFTEYALARVTRLAPPLLLMIVLVSGLSLVLSALGLATLPEGVMAPRSHFATRWREQLLALATLCLRGDLTGDLNRPMWTLALEIQLYVLAGLVLLVATQRAAWQRVAGGVALVAYAWLDGVRMTSHEARDLGIHLTCFACFGLGWLTSTHADRLRPFARGAMGAGVLVSALLLGRVGRADFTEIETTLPLVSAELALGLAACALLLELSTRTVSHRLSQIGTFSFTLYAIHFPLQLFLYFLLVRALPHYPMAAGALLGLVATAAVIALSWVLGRWIERPAAQKAWVLRRFARRPAPPATP